MLKNSVSLKPMELLGEGSQGRVYRAIRQDRDAGLVQTVALKILHSKTAVDLWRQEFESLSRVRSRYCVQVLSFERWARRPALLLEYIDGCSLAQLTQSSLFSDEIVDEILAQIECGLKDLERVGIVHGDLSPSNVLVDSDGQIRLLDFGLANCNTSDPRLTPRFAAPERLNGVPATISADLFSLGRIEEILRTKPLEPGRMATYLHADPKQRRFRDLKPRPARQLILSRMVLERLEIQRQARAVVTQTQKPVARLTPRPTLHLTATVALIFLLLTASTSQSLLLPPHSSLKLRTARWHFILMDGRPMGYTPLNLSISANQIHRIEWIAARGHGQLEVELPPNATRSLHDSDLSH